MEDKGFIGLLIAFVLFFVVTHILVFKYGEYKMFERLKPVFTDSIEQTYYQGYDDGLKQAHMECVEGLKWKK